jgi:adenylate cyclase
MIVYGFPAASRPDVQIQNAINTAKMILDDLQTLNDYWRANSLPTFQVRVGLHSGPVVVGSFGGRVRSDYTAIGPTVNVAARIEAQAEPDSIFMSATSQSYASDIPVDDMGKFKLKGVSESMKLYRVRYKVTNDQATDHSSLKTGRSA